MKKGKHKPAGFFYTAGVLAVFTFFAACKTPLGGLWEYQFSNKTSYSIRISLDKGYKLSKESGSSSSAWGDSEPFIYTDFILYSGSSGTVYVESDSVGFGWTAGSTYNRYIYPEKDGSRVTFKERSK
jgi:hypothetical protein